MEREEERLDEIVIPINCNEDFNIGPYSFPTLRVVEAVIFGALGAGITYLIQTVFKVSFGKFLAFLIIFAGAGAAIGLNGINGDSIFTYIVNMIKFNKTKRYTQYNPRVKKEKKYFVDINPDNDAIIPVEKLQDVYQTMFTKQFINNSKIKDADESNIIFEDDIEASGHIPEDKMTAKELKTFLKKKKKEEKKEAKIRKKEAKLYARKENKKAKVAGIRR